MSIEVVATVLFGIAIVHTFSSNYIRRLGGRYPEGSIAENLLHLLGEVEVVFGIWAGVLALFLVGLWGGERSLHFFDHDLNFTEPMFVFVIMTIAATRPVLHFANGFIRGVARIIPLKGEVPFYFTALVVGPLLGSFITEPAAMTVTALVLRDRLFERVKDRRFLYLSLGILFVNVSIGGVLTPFAAPPVLMVAGKWGWDIKYMMLHFGEKAVLAVILNALLGTAVGWKILTEARVEGGESGRRLPAWLVGLHLLFLGLVVVTSHHPNLFMGLFLFFLGVMAVTTEYQEPPKLKESLLVAFFLGGLVVLGSFQSWWLKPVLESLTPTALYFATAALTALTDNAALTFLGAQVPGLTETMKYALVAGAVSGGGLTVIANAPNPAGYSILRESFGEKGISPLGLLAGALLPTSIALAAFWFLPF